LVFEVIHYYEGAYADAPHLKFYKKFKEIIEVDVSITITNEDPDIDCSPYIYTADVDSSIEASNDGSAPITMEGVT
jgi:hypothetical protein